MWNYILTFETKLRLWEFQINKNNYQNFPTLYINKQNTNLHF